MGEKISPPKNFDSSASEECYDQYCQTPLQLADSTGLRLDGVGVDFVFPCHMNNKKEGITPTLLLPVGMSLHNKHFFVSRGCRKGAWRVSEWCLEGLFRVSGECLANSTRTCKPNSTSIGWSRSCFFFPIEGRRKEGRRNNPHLASSRRNDPTCLNFGDFLVGI